MSNALGAHIALEVARADGDMQTLRSRAQALLTLAGGLVTALSAVLALVASSASLTLNELAKATAGVALSLFFIAAVAVAIMFRPRDVKLPTVETLREAVDQSWDNPRVEETVALSDLTHLQGLRAVNSHLANLLAAAVVAQVLGLFCVLALTLIVLASA